MIERVKSIVLFLLVVTSLVLSWQLWTYQTQHDYLLPADYVPHEGLAERKETIELVRPKRMVYHYGDDQYRLLYPGMFQYENIADGIANWDITHLRVAEQHIVRSNIQNRLEKEWIEMQFPTAVPFSFLVDMYEWEDVEAEQIDLEINAVRIWPELDSDDVYIDFLSSGDSSLVRGIADIDAEQLRSYVSWARSLTVFERVQVDRRTFEYLPTEPIDINEYQYFYQRTQLDDVISHLFVDPSLVRPIEERDRGLLFTDGTRAVQYLQDHHVMYFYHPVSDPTTSDDDRDSALQRSIQFVNQHEGWEKSYQLSDTRFAEDANPTIIFRQYIPGGTEGSSFPVYANRMADDATIQLEVHGDRIVRYMRPMLELDQEMEVVRRTLPSGPQLLAYLESDEYRQERMTEAGERADTANIERISVGYKSYMRSHHVRYVPHWVIHFANGAREFIREVPQEIMEQVAAEQAEAEQEDDESSSVENGGTGADESLDDDEERGESQPAAEEESNESDSTADEEGNNEASDATGDSTAGEVDDRHVENTHSTGSNEAKRGGKAV